MRRIWVVAALVLLLVCGPISGSARAAEGYQQDVLWGMAAVGASLLYSPAKVVYATLGGIVGGMTYLCTAGNVEVAQRVWSTSLGGTYVLTPAMLRGEQSILFAGETYGW